MPRSRKRERPPAEKLAPVPNEILDQFAPDRPLSAAEVEAATRRFKKTLIERALGAECERAWTLRPHAVSINEPTHKKTDTPGHAGASRDV